MTHLDMTEYKLYELGRVIEDLTCLAHERGCAPVIGQEIEKHERRLKDLRLDCQSFLQAAE